jgi:hypothetical protein
MNLKKLTALFKKLGAKDPSGWAKSQIDEGIPQLARYIFLRQAWRCVVSEEDSSWIDLEIDRASKEPDAPYSGVGIALKKIRERGATDEELTDVVRGTQAEMLFHFCYLLDDPGELEPEVADMEWMLVQFNAKGNVDGSIVGLHESVLETDPTGREMRPRKTHSNVKPPKRNNKKT